MTDPYTPTTEEMRSIAADYFCPDPDADHTDGCPGDAFFDRWLAQHDAELRQQVAREFLEIMDRPTTWSEETRLPKLLRLFDALRAYAARLAKGRS